MWLTQLKEAACWKIRDWMLERRRAKEWKAGMFAGCCGLGRGYIREVVADVEVGSGIFVIFRSGLSLIDLVV